MVGLGGRVLCLRRFSLSFRQRMSKIFRNNWAIRVLTAVIIFSVWEVIGRINPFFVAPPSKIVLSLYKIIVSGELFQALAVSVRHLSVGYALSATLGISLGLLMGVSRKIEYALDPYVTAMQATPLSGFIPLLIILFGVGDPSRIAVVFVFALFPILINTMTGVKNVDRNLIETGESFGAGKITLFTKVYLPASVPYIMSGLRIGIERSIRGMVLAEIFIIAGLGKMLMRYGAAFDIATVFAVLAVLMCLGISLSQIVKYAERKVSAWRVYR